MDTYTILLIGGTALLSFAATALLGRPIIPWLRRLKFGQTIREVGPAWHKGKQGTPTMGGFLFIGGMAVALLAALPLAQYGLHPAMGGGSLTLEEAQRWLLRDAVFPDRATMLRLLAGLGLMLACGAIGLADDYIKVVKRRNLGLTGGQKLFAQLAVGLIYAVLLYRVDGGGWWLPVAGTLELGVWFVPLTVFWVVGFSNATNLTDGIDGLCATVSLVAALPFLVLSGLAGLTGQSLVAAAFAGGMLGFLVWNLHPAKVFMGDTGSLFIGGAMCALAFGVGKPILLLPVGLVYVLETASVMLQVTYFKLTCGKRLFKMSPLHHHLELCGMGENAIVASGVVLTLIGGAVAVLISL